VNGISIGDVDMVATSKKTRQGLKPLQESHISIWPGGCNEQENPTGIETWMRMISNRGNSNIVATSKKTRQGLKLAASPFLPCNVPMLQRARKPDRD